MTTYAQLSPTGVVMNVVTLDDEAAAALTSTLVPIDDKTLPPAPGSTWDGKAFAPPAPPAALSLEGQIEQIDEETAAAVAEGFEWEGLRVDMGDTAAIKILAVIAATQAGLMTFPLDWSALNGKSFAIQDAPTLFLFYGTAFGTRKMLEEIGVQKKAAIVVA